MDIHIKSCPVTLECIDTATSNKQWSDSLLYIIHTDHYFTIKILSNSVQTQVYVIYTKVEIQYTTTFTAMFKQFKVFTTW